MNDAGGKMDEQIPEGSKAVEPSNQDHAAELPEADLAKVAGGKQKPDGTAAGNVAAKWNVAQGAAA